MTVANYDEFMKEDIFFKELIEAVKTEGLNKTETVSILRFLGNFVLNSKKYGMEELGELFSKRVSVFVYYIQSQGYKYGKFSKGEKTFGIDTLISQAYYDLLPDKK